MSYITIQNLNKKFKDNYAVKNLNLNIQKGELFGLLGPNGAGKSTTISILTGLLRQDSGKVSINNMDILKQPNEIKKMIGYVPQDIVLYETLTAYENLYFWGRLYNLRGAKLKNSIEEVLKVVGLQDKKNKRVDSFSGGMKRRINIGAAILHEPEIVIMDEPTVGIDPQSRNHILDTVKKLNKTKYITFIYTTHYMEEVESICSKICIIDKGKEIAYGTKEEIRNILGNKDTIFIKFRYDLQDNIKKELSNIKDVFNLKIKDNTVQMTSENSIKSFEEITQIIKKFNLEVDDINIKKPSLESVFLHLTGKELRD